MQRRGALDDVDPGRTRQLHVGDDQIPRPRSQPRLGVLGRRTPDHLAQSAEELDQQAREDVVIFYKQDRRDAAGHCQERLVVRRDEASDLSVAPSCRARSSRCRLGGLFKRLGDCLQTMLLQPL